MLTTAVLDAMRAELHTTGAQDRWLKDPIAWGKERLGDHIWTKQADIATSVASNPRTAVKSCHGIGKALPLTTEIPTPDGWATMADLRIGDRVIGADGKPCTITGKSPVWNLNCYSITFDDGTTQVCTGEHEWSVIDLRHRPRHVKDWRDHWNATVTMDTRSLAASLTVGGQKRWRVPTTKAIDLPDAELPVDPYTLGVWLGDGTSCRPEITCDPADVETMERIASKGENVRHLSRFSWSLTGPVEDRKRLRVRLRELHVLDNKHIPVLYMRASSAQRLEMLRGLMDSDGFNSGSGVGMDLCDESLASDVAELVASLGWKITTRTAPATCNGRPAGTRWRMYFCPDVPVFHLARKRAAQTLRGAQMSRQTQRTIVSIEPVETVPTVCIEVDSPNHLYLCGRLLIPTHNSFIAARTALWWIDAHPPGSAIVVSTAPTYQQVHAILWEEIRKGHRKGGLPGVVLKSDEWQSDQGDIVGFGRKPADTDEHGFQGIHRRYVLVIIDEACGVPKQLFTAAEAIATNTDCRILAIGNPDDPGTEFGEVCKPGSGYTVISVSAFDTPNFTDEPVPEDLAALLISPAWVEDKRRRWGTDSPLWTSKVLGEFPEISQNTLIRPAWIQAAQDRTCESVGPHTLGVDVARFGTDKTTIATRVGGIFRIATTLNVSATTTTAGHVAALQRQQAATVGTIPVAQVDTVGVGGGVADILRETAMPVADMNAGIPALDSRRFLNARAEWYWNLRTLFEAGLVDIDPADDDLAAELAGIRYQLDSRGRVRIESKDDMKARGVHSPDRADAMMLAFAAPRETHKTGSMFFDIG